MSNRPDRTVEVVPYSATWPDLFRQERDRIEAALGPLAATVEHIGSTAVLGLSAKPTIDILVTVDSIDELRRHIPALEAIGWDHRANNTMVGSDDHLFFRKVVGGKRTHHLHVLRTGSREVDDYRLFRDALRSDPALASRYAEVKLALAAEHALDRVRYTVVKGEWVADLISSLR